jgi:arabinose operon protein AraL
VSPSAKLDFTSLTVFVFDLDGVVYLGNEAIPHAADSINQLQSRGKKIYFLTNNSGNTRTDYVRKLSKMGIDVGKERIYTSAYATALHLQEIGATKSNVFVLGESGVQQELRDVGINVYTEPGSIASDQIDFVVSGIDRQFTYSKLAFAHEAIVRGRAKFIATNRDSTYPSETGTVPGAGSLVIALATSTGCEPLTIGKPEPTALLEIIRAAGANAATTLMVGDRLDTDIAGGNRSGTRTACVLTGVTTRQAAEAAEGELRPSFIIDDLRNLTS